MTAGIMTMVLFWGSFLLFILAIGRAIGDSRTQSRRVPRGRPNRVRASPFGEPYLFRH
jgi:hypothetical protein